jgi:hypothetical protein
MEVISTVSRDLKKKVSPPVPGSRLHSDCPLHKNHILLPLSWRSGWGTQHNKSKCVSSRNVCLRGSETTVKSCKKNPLLASHLCQLSPLHIFRWVLFRSILPWLVRARFVLSEVSLSMVLSEFIAFPVSLSSDQCSLPGYSFIHPSITDVV